MELITARATTGSKQVSTRYGERILIEAELLTDRPTFEKIWTAADTIGADAIKPGQHFLVGRNRNGKLNFIDSQPEAGAPPAPAPRPVQPIGFHTQQPAQPAASGSKPAPAQAAGDAKAAIADDAVRFTRIYAYCYQQAREAMPDAPAEAIQACASSAWIAVSRKHGLS